MLLTDKGIKYKVQNLLTRIISFWYRANVLTYGISGKLKVEEGNKEEKKGTDDNYIAKFELCNPFEIVKF